MAHFTHTFEGRAHVLITDATLGPPFDFGQTQRPPPRESLKNFKAIWDTGATNTVITQRAVELCGFEPIGMIRTRGVHGEKDAPVFLACLELPCNVGFSSIRVTLGDLGSDADILIGMDVISTGDFAVTNHCGKTAMSFRHPSQGKIDFGIAGSSSGRPPKLGRNDLCHCGSGKKHKHCHGS